MSRERLDPIRGLLVYVSRMYQDMNPYLKVIYLTLYSWRTYRDGEVRKLRVEALKMVELEGKWGGV